MEYSLSILIGTIVGLIIISGFFSGSETSLTSASKPRMHELAKSGDKKAKLFTKIFKDKEILIGTILFANNLVNVLASAIATKILIEITNDDGIVYATIIMTLMILIFGELIPKTIALSNSDKFALKIAPFMRIIIIILYPLTKFLNILVALILKIFGVDYKTINKEELSENREEELRGAIDLHGEHPSTGDEKEMLKSILDLDDITVGSIMIPRKDIFSLPSTYSLDELLLRLKDSPHSRIPIWEKNPENIIGILHVRKLIEEFGDDCPIMDYVMLKPNTVLSRHTGATNIGSNRVRIHLPIIIPDGRCFLEINGKPIYWKDGPFGFNDEYVHSACNLTNQYRVIWMMDMERERVGLPYCTGADTTLNKPLDEEIDYERI